MNSIVIFILKYWVLILVVCVVALMMIIGYYAESNGLVQKDLNEKPSKKSKKEKESITVEDVQESSGNEQFEDIQNSGTSEQPIDEFNFVEDSSVADISENNDNSQENVSTVTEEANGTFTEQPVAESMDFNYEPDVANNVQVEVDASESEEPEVPETFEEFEEYFDNVLPEKPVISDELQKYIDEFQITPLSMSKDKKEVDTNIHLPEIKNKELDDDVWSF